MSNSSELPAIDTSTAQALPASIQPALQRGGNTLQPLVSPYCNVFGYAAAQGTNNTCGPCALACVLDFYQIGWSHIPKANDGHPDNEAFVREVMKWSGAPDILFGVWGTSPMRMQESLAKAGLRSNWYANGTESSTLHYIEQELRAGRPVIVLVDYGHLGKNFMLDWQVVFQMDANFVYTKINSARNQTQQWDKATFNLMMTNQVPNANRTLVTAVK